MKNLSGKVAVVTGAASGIGKSLAESFLREGMRIVLSDIDEKALEMVTNQLKNKGGDVIRVITDVSDPDSVNNLAERTIEKYKRVDILCNNAGVGFGNGAVWENSIQDWNWVLGVNLMGTIHGIKTFVPIMEKQNTKCHIINTSSSAGIGIGAGSSPYAVSKHGVVALSESLFNDLSMRGSMIGVSVLCPGFVNTNILDPLRSRPERFGTYIPVSQPSQAAMIDGAFKYAIENGLDPDVVADKAVKGIKEGQFYILTHPEVYDMAKARCESILENRKPVASMPGEFIEFFNR